MSSQRTIKHFTVTNNSDLLYHIDANKSITNVQQLAAFIVSLVAGFINTREKLYVRLLTEAGYSVREIASATGQSYQNIYRILDLQKGKDTHV